MKKTIRISLKIGLRLAGLIGFFSLALVLVFAAYGTFGKVPMAFTWIGFFLLLSWGLLAAYQEYKDSRND